MRLHRHGGVHVSWFTWLMCSSEPINQKTLCTIIMNYFSHSILYIAFLVKSLSVMIQAQELTAIPMQGGMVMPSIHYNAMHNHLSVSVPETVPQLTTLAMSHPDRHFSSTAPWYDLLDPAVQGQSFNRQYGFVMDGSSDLLPAGTAIWIRQISATEGLHAYQYRSGGPLDQAWVPMFGTDGSSDVLTWNMKMYHPTYVTSMGHGSLMADYEAFVVDLDTGESIPDIQPASFTLHWVRASMGGQPTLSIARKLVLSWGGDIFRLCPPILRIADRSRLGDPGCHAHAHERGICGAGGSWRPWSFLSPSHGRGLGNGWGTHARR
jgi:hypothetical protein